MLFRHAQSPDLLNRLLVSVARFELACTCFQGRGYAITQHTVFFGAGERNRTSATRSQAEGAAITLHPLLAEEGRLELPDGFTSAVFKTVPRPTGVNSSIGGE